MWCNNSEKVHLDINASCVNVVGSCTLILKCGLGRTQYINGVCKETCTNYNKVTNRASGDHILNIWLKVQINIQRSI